MNAVDLDIIQPCYNPLPDWEESVWLHFSELQKLMPGVTINLVVVNDGSSKNVVPEKIDYLRQRIPLFQYITYEPNRGKGYALRQGVAAAKGTYQLITDIDFPFELPHIPEMYQELLRGADVVSGVRRQNYYQTLSLKRLMASKASQLLNRFFLRLPFNDTQSGIKGFNSKGRQAFLATTIDRYLADTEFLALAAKRRLHIRPLEVSLRPDVHLSHMSLRIFMSELKNFVRVYSIMFRSTGK